MSIDMRNSDDLPPPCCGCGRPIVANGRCELGHDGSLGFCGRDPLPAQAVLAKSVAAAIARVAHAVEQGKIVKFSISWDGGNELEVDATLTSPINVVSVTGDVG